ncbi:hypothetical protein BY458DRAFT_507020 [Sporodiniella umbellata]|nr:hypothetical protein BY458DRAFT_507020 [Sporodiniella umbellata]
MAWSKNYTNFLYTVRFTHIPTETDSFGYLIQNTQIETPNTENVEPKTAHFEPLYSKIWTDDVKPRQCMLPVFYEDGKFFEDIEAENYHDIHESFLPTPIYDRPLKDIRLSTCVCFNCGTKGHGYEECSEVLCEKRVRDRRRELNLSRPGKRRFYDELGLIYNANRMAPEGLKESLGMLMESNESSYYEKINKLGYPPGYLDGTPYHPLKQQSYTIHQDDLNFSSAPLLKVYNNDSTSQTEVDVDVTDSNKYPTQDIYPNLFDHTKAYHSLQGYEDMQTHSEGNPNQVVDYSHDPNYHYYYYYHYYQNMYLDSLPPESQQSRPLEDQNLGLYTSEPCDTCQVYDQEISTPLPNFLPETNDECIDMDISDEE